MKLTREGFDLPPICSLAFVPTPDGQWAVVEVIIAIDTQEMELEALFIGSHEKAMAHFVEESHNYFKSRGGSLIGAFGPKEEMN